MFTPVNFSIALLLCQSFVCLFIQYCSSMYTMFILANIGCNYFSLYRKEKSRVSPAFHNFHQGNPDTVIRSYSLKCTCKKIPSRSYFFSLRFRNHWQAPVLRPSGLLSFLLSEHFVSLIMARPMISPSSLT